MISWSTSDIAGIHFGDTHITVARVKCDRSGRLVITHAGWTPWDSRESEKKCAAEVRELWRKTKIPTKMVCSSLRSASLVMRYFRMPYMSALELESALGLQAEEALQLPKDQVAVDWYVHGGKAGAGNAIIEGILSAAPLKDVTHQLSILSMAGLDPVIVDIRALAVANLYLDLGGLNDAVPTCVVSLTPHSADIIMMGKEGKIYPYTVFCRASTWEQEPAFLSENIRDVLRYSEFKLDWPRAQRILLTGQVPTAPAFVEGVKEMLKLEVELWNPLDKVDVKTQDVKDLLAADPAGAAMLGVSLGLAIRRR